MALSLRSFLRISMYGCFILVLFGVLNPAARGQSVSYEGTWTNTSFGSSGASSFSVDVNGADVSLTFDLGGGVFGMGDPPPVTLAGEVTSTGIVFRQDDHSFFGDILINVFLDGTFRMEFNNVPSSGIDRQVSTGVLTRGKLDTDYEVFFSSGGSAAGTGELNHQSGSLPTLNFLSQYGNGDNFSSDLVASNPTDETVNAFLLLSNDDGEPLQANLVSDGTPVMLNVMTQLDGMSVANFQVPPLDSVTISSSGQGSLKVGSAVIASASDVGSVVRFAFPGVGVAGVGEAERYSHFMIPARRIAGDIRTGLAIYNPNAVAVTANLRLRSNGQDVDQATIQDLPPFGHRARFIEEFFDGVDTSNFSGSIIVQSEGDFELTAVAIELGNDPGEFTTLPVTQIN